MVFASTATAWDTSLKVANRSRNATNAARRVTRSRNAGQRNRELQTDRAQSLRQEVTHAEEGARVEDRPNREVLNTQELRDRIKGVARRDSSSVREPTGQ
jgi:hypothetical protein